MEQKNAMNKNVRPAAPAAPKGEAKGGSAFAAIVIPLAFVVSVIVYLFVFGNGSNFQGGDNANNPLPGNYLGLVYKGGPIVPLLLTFFLLVFTFSIERFLTISKA